jgi:hypothetical protein
MDVEKIARKFAWDADDWYGIDVSVRRVAEFSGLRHPHHQRGAVVAWEIPGETYHGSRSARESRSRIG